MQEVCCVTVVGVWWNVVDVMMCLFGAVEAVLKFCYCWQTSGGLLVVRQHFLESGHP